MTGIDPQTTTLGELVLEQPWRAQLFEQLGFDYCCGGDRTLAAACAQAELDVDTVVRVLATRLAPAHAGAHERDWRQVSTAELCDHIVEAHHDRLRQELPRLGETAATVARVHGPDEPDLREVARVFDGLARDLLEHVEREEELLFPACRALEAGERPAAPETLLAELTDDHADVGETLVILRGLAGDYRREHARCGTHRLLLDGLESLEHDLHQHIHEENNLLFPRVREQLVARA